MAYAERGDRLYVAYAADNADNETYKKIVELYHTEEVQAVVQEDTQGTAVEVTSDVSELRSTLATLEEQKRNG